MSVYYDLGLVVGPQGPQGETGPQGPQGPQGPAGPSGGLPSGGTAGQVLTKTANGETWADPAGGADKQDKITASGLLKGDGNGSVSAAAAGTDYQAPLPAQSGNSGKFLTTNGSALSWSAVSVPAASSASPQMDGTAAAGSSGSFARADHVHPSDTAKQNAITASGVLQGDGQGNISAKTVDTAATSGSTNLITSGAVYTAILGAIGGSY